MRIDPCLAPSNMDVSRPTTAGAKSGIFEDLLRNTVVDANKQQVRAEDAMASFLRGDQVDPAAVVSAINQADLALRTMVQIRNKLVQAFEELRQMQI